MPRCSGLGEREWIGKSCSPIKVAPRHGEMQWIGVDWSRRVDWGNEWIGKSCSPIKVAPRPCRDAVDWSGRSGLGRRVDWKNCSPDVDKMLWTRCSGLGGVDRLDEMNEIGRDNWTSQLDWIGHWTWWTTGDPTVSLEKGKVIRQWHSKFLFKKAYLFASL